jgi:phosphopantothenoylcysteine decarboxylase/phosphopantothenate--cysteine ligase
MTIVLCVTGSVAAVETVKLARELKRGRKKIF